LGWVLEVRLRGLNREGNATHNLKAYHFLNEIGVKSQLGKEKGESMNVRLFVGLLLFVGGILALYFAVALSFVAFSKEYVFPLVLLAVILLVFGIWLINPLGIWSDSI